MNNSYWDGFAARVQGKKLTANPKKVAIERAQWSKGWRSADAKQNEGSHLEHFEMNPKKRNSVTRKKAVTCSSQVTNKKPSARLVARRKKEVIPGYFPNPLRPFLVEWSQDKGMTWAELCACDNEEKARHVIDCVSDAFINRAFMWRLMRE